MCPSTLAFTSKKQSSLHLPNPLQKVNSSLDYRKKKAIENYCFLLNY